MVCAKSKTPMDYLRVLYEAFGAPYPRASLCVVILVGGIISGVLWRALGKSYQKGISQSPPQPTVQTPPKSPNPVPETPQRRAPGPLTGKKHRPEPKLPKPIECITKSYEEISSPYEKFPYAIAVTLQTTVPISPVHIRLKCDAPIRQADVSFAPAGAISVSNIWNKQMVIKGSILDFSFDQPPFTPQRPLVVRILSDSPIKPLSVDRVY